MEQMAVYVEYRRNGKTEDEGRWLHPPIDLSDVMVAFDLAVTPRDEDLIFTQYVLPFDIEPGIELEELNRMCRSVLEIEAYSTEIAENIELVCFHFGIPGVTHLHSVLEQLHVFHTGNMEEAARDMVALKGQLDGHPVEDHLLPFLDYREVAQHMENSGNFLQLPSCVVEYER